MSDSVSICVTLKNRAHLLKYMLESLRRQDYDHKKMEICVLDGGSTDSLMSVLDRASDEFVIKIAVEDRLKSYIPIVSNAPAASINLMVRYMASHDNVVKIDPEVILKDAWIISEIVEGLKANKYTTYNVRTHFTREDGWFHTYDDIVSDYEKHYLFAEGGPFSRSKFYFCSGFSRALFIDMGGIEELMGLGVGYEDTLFREVFNNRYSGYETEVTGQAIHLWHGPNKSRSAWEVANGRLYDYLKGMPVSNVVRIDGSGKLYTKESPEWANPEMLSKIYTIQGGAIVKTDDINDGNSVELSLPF